MLETPRDPQLRFPAPFAIATSLLVTAALSFTGCGLVGGVQSALAPAGRGAQAIASLFWWSAAGLVAIWLAVVALGAWALRKGRKPASFRRASTLLIVGGGAIFPTAVLTGYLTYGLAELPDLLEPAPPGSLRVFVSGEQWWWRVRYERPGAAPVVLANEIHLPVGEPVEFVVESPDVIHSFWIPSLGPKMDMIPGRTNRITLHPTKVGRYRGVCAEYCGASHALMAFHVVVEERAAFDRWLERQAAPAAEPESAEARRGRALFLGNGCGACHAVRGTPADGVVGPDLTHVGSRATLGAGTLPNEPEAYVRWIGSTQHVKPEVRMPAFGMLPPADLRAMALYLEGLE